MELSSVLMPSQESKYNNSMSLGVTIVQSSSNSRIREGMASMMSPSFSKTYITYSSFQLCSVFPMTIQHLDLSYRARLRHKLRNLKKLLQLLRSLILRPKTFAF